jgi:hypothetical protein
MSELDYTRAAIEARLRTAARLSAPLSSATPRVLMTRAAIELRLRQASELNRACLRLMSLKSD